MKKLTPPKKGTLKLTWQQLEELAKKQGLPVIAVLDSLVHQMIKQN